MNSAKKYQMKDGWTAEKVAEAACDELARLESLGHRPGFAIIEFDAEEGDRHTAKVHLFTGFYHDENGVKCAFCASLGCTRTFSPSTEQLFVQFLKEGSTVIIDELWWGGFTHAGFFVDLGWDYLKMIVDGLSGLDPQMKKA